MMTNRKTLKNVLRRLPPQELERVKPLSDEEIDAALELGASERRQVEAWMSSYPGCYG